MRFRKKDNLVLELKRLALAEPCNFEGLLRHALIAASELGMDDFRLWTLNQLNGYKGITSVDELPEFRQVKGVVKCVSHAHDLWQDVVFSDPNYEAEISFVGIPDPVAQIQSLLTTDKGFVEYPLQLKIKHALMRQHRLRFEPTRFVDTSLLVGILDQIRTTILEWSINLQKQGINGVGMSFTTEEKRSVTNGNVFNISNAQVVFGSVHDSHLIFGNENILHSQLSECDIGIEERQVFERIADDLKKTEDKKKRKSLATDALAWIDKNKTALGLLAKQLTDWISKFM